MIEQRREVASAITRAVKWWRQERRGAEAIRCGQANKRTLNDDGRRRASVNYRDFFRLVVRAAGERDAETGRERGGHVAAVEHDDDDLVRRRARLFKALVRLVQQLLQLLCDARSIGHVV